MTFAPSTAISVKAPPPVERSNLKPCSFVALSVQARLIWLGETALAVRLLGIAGGDSVVAVAGFEYAESLGPS